jgi:thioredoxin reductase (NADPH)
MPEQDLQSVAFPRLDPKQVAGLAACTLTMHESYHDGDVIVEAGDRDFKFYVVASGAVEILDISGETPVTIKIHGPGEFTGDVAHVTGRVSPMRMVARGDTDVHGVTSEALRQIVNLHPDLGDIILQAFIARRQLIRASGTFTGLRVIGSRYSQDTFRIRDFLARNRVPFTWLDLEGDPHVKELLTRFGFDEDDTPVVAWGTKILLRNPSDRAIAESLGLRQPLEQVVYDLVVVGAGPAGLAAAVYGASEGLSTLVLERTAPGGQAGTSMRIENYLGFPTGISGSDLADRAMLQANKFGARLPVPTPVHGLSFENAYCVLHLEDDEKVLAKCLLIATGAEYRRLAVDDFERFEGRGIYYAATPNEALLCRGADVIVVGGGNSAGQAAVFLAGSARKVLLAVRSNDLGRNMSSYLARRIEQTPNVEVMLETEVKRLSGDGHLGEVELATGKTRETRSLRCPAVFSFIGATPRTDWLPKEIERDEKKFLRTGLAVARSPQWSLARQPYLLETSRPGVFAAGDVRAGSVKRVASAVGEGAAAVQLVHEYLKEM